jgi:GNAT superfamily N-acetyltransferase
MVITTLTEHPHHLPTIAEWYYEEWGRYTGMSLEDEVNRQQKYLHSDRLPLMLIAIEGDQIAGATQLKFYEMGQYPDYEHWIGGVYVDTPFRNKGLASKLVREAYRIAGTFGVPALYLQTQNMTGGLYRKLGWEPIHETVSHGLDTLVMVKRLTADGSLPSSIPLSPVRASTGMSDFGGQERLTAKFSLSM